ncbi:hypothetical protein AK88_03311 [Plasmodium fragile]|uniref:Plasmodium falciparum erythrocyte membrane protein 1 acidic terminal segment domain-containing protein n=1 Tax=Plasmodium fragile TaxID=5857 RepID=A0A0D9QJ22_PLAFR|nr:uncharacterized protein AK88_03311 [Plasmodium fragile]KJP87029.1 hypothetical protein AK88_03311 [Plasmodium fragile]
MRRILPISAGPMRLPPIPLRLVRRILLLLVVLVLLTAGGVAKCEVPDEGRNQVDTRNTTEERIMDVLNSVSVDQSIKRERNILDDVANYMHYLRMLNMVVPHENVEGEGFINVDTTGKGAKEKRRVHIVYSSQGNNYKNNLNDVRREVNRVLFT